NDDLLTALYRLQPLGIRLHELLLHVAGLDRRHRPAHVADAPELLARFALELFDLARDFAGAVENIAVIEQVGLVGKNLLHTQRPLLVPWTRQAERFVPGWQLHGAGARTLR